MLQPDVAAGKKIQVPRKSSKYPLLCGEQSLQPTLALYFQFHVYLKVTKPGGLENAFIWCSSLLSAAVIT